MSLTIQQALANSQLDPVDARALLRHVLGTDDASLITRAGESLPDAQSALFSALVRRRKAGEPVAYVMGTREFFSLEFKVTPAVLIPRPETELLVEFALECIAPDGEARVLDLGTGSGCIAISIARQRPRAQIVAVDASAAALTVAHDNARRLLSTPLETPFPLRGAHGFPLPSGEGPRVREGSRVGTEGEGTFVCGDGGDADAERDSSTPTLTLPRQGGGDLSLRFLQSDWFSALAAWQFDLIVANPPYVAAGDSHLAGELRFEPQAALVAGADGLACIRLIIAEAPQHLNAGAWLAFEHGYDQSERCRELLTRAGFERVFSRPDLAGIERVSGGQWSARP